MVVHSEEGNPDYLDPVDGDHDTSSSGSHGGSEDVDGSNSKQVRIVIIATIVTCSLLILVVTAILGE